jgi:hypothetical protein
VAGVCHAPCAAIHRRKAHGRQFPRTESGADSRRDRPRLNAVVPGDVQGVDRTVDLHTTGWAPYPLRWTLRITEPMTDAGFALAAHGDLGGSGPLCLRQDGPEVGITDDWRIVATKPLLRRLSRLLRPAFEANHRWAMARGEESAPRGRDARP